ncbi:hypothetical protein QQS21_002745 [Conoideocrella luteorostrata]|uniref:Negative acting factor n=1 Tax=Conoideocrella luteorostrata TaxID=1105319 RepID=A0AAJ0CUM4_9HYPO|nr:hypothetical protein QQS21_002745 [Conoideocrella luteorostrata]
MPTAVKIKTSSSSTKQLIIESPTIPLEEKASCHFVANYCLIPHSGGMRGFLDFLIPLLKVRHHLPHLRHAFEACAVASLNNAISHKDEYDKLALANYTQALSTTATALRNPAMMKDDATLAAVYLLCLFETITARSVGTVAWGSHIRGLLLLIRARGSSQLQTKSGLDLFVTCRTQGVGSTSLFRHFSVSAPNLALQIVRAMSAGIQLDVGIEVPSKLVYHEPVLHAQELSLVVCKLKKDATDLLSKPPTADNMSLLRKLVHRCKAMDQQLIEWTHSLPESYSWKTVAWEYRVPRGDYSTAEVYPGCIDIYKNVWAASLLNNMRACRIVASSIMVRCVALLTWPNDYRTTIEYAAVTKLWGEEMGDIMASVPYLLGWFNNRMDLLENSVLSGYGCGDNNAAKTLPGLLLIWPLSAMEAHDYTTDAQRAWIRGRLKYIGMELGVKSAIEKPKPSATFRKRPANQGILKVSQ